MREKMFHKSRKVTALLSFTPLILAAILSITSVLDSNISLKSKSPSLHFELMPNACKYFLSEEKNQHPCNASLAIAKAAEASLAGGCFPHSASRCKGPDLLLTHTWLERIHWNDPGKVQALKMLLRSWLITQDLTRSRYYLWTMVDSFDILEQQSGSQQPPGWFQEFYPYVSLQFFNYSIEIMGTPLEHSRHFDAWGKLMDASMDITTLSDIVRNLLLHNYGGIWLDNDAVPLRDLWNVTAGLGLQLIPKFYQSHSNNHFLYIHCPRSALAKRRLEHLVLFPYKHQDAWPRMPLTGIPQWVYNDGLSEHTLAVQASKYNIPHELDGDSKSMTTSVFSLPSLAYEDLEVPMPIGWFDPVWVCGDSPHFFELTACDGAFIWHRLAKHPVTPGDKFWHTERFWQEVLEKENDGSMGERGWDLEPRILHGAHNC